MTRNHHRHVLTIEVGAGELTEPVLGGFQFVGGHRRQRDVLGCRQPFQLIICLCVISYHALCETFHIRILGLRRRKFCQFNFCHSVVGNRHYPGGVIVTWRNASLRCRRSWTHLRRRICVPVCVLVCA